MVNKVIYAKLSKRSPVQHIAYNDGTLCNTTPIAIHRLDAWEWSQGRGKWFPDRRMCFNCWKVIMRQQGDMDTMRLAESLYTGRNVRLKVVS